MAGRSSHMESPRPGWEEVEIIDRRGRACVARRPLAGARFGALCVLEPGTGADSQTRVRCDCGAEFELETRAIYRGRKGCRPCTRFSADRQRAAPEVAIFQGSVYWRNVWVRRWLGMVARCHNPKHQAFAGYGGRGIRVCDKWRKDRRAFFRYVVTHLPWDQVGLGLGRKDNDRGYEPGNVRLVTRRENARNRRRTVRVQYGRRAYPVTEFRERFCPGWVTGTVRFHLAQGRTGRDIVACYRASRGL